MKHVNVYGTLGPACREPDTLKQMISEGLDGMRLNLSHAALEDASDLIDAYRTAAKACGKTPRLLIDMQGPELRIGDLKEPVCLNAGETVSIDTVPFPDAVLSVLSDCPSGQEILLDDGKLLLKTGESGRLLVTRGGILESRKSVALLGHSFDTPAMTETDRKHIRLAADYGVTAVMQPFVRSKEDLIGVRSALDCAGGREIRLLAKIESTEGVQALSELIPYCDEIVIARGDLGNAVPLWELPAVQKRIAADCRAAGRDFTVVTQMLDSMIQRPIPTRAEVCDIFNAVLDGAASVMLTGETATGAYPVAAIRYLVRTVRAAEAFANRSSD